MRRSGACAKLRASAFCSSPYSPECVEEEFSEVRGSKLPRPDRGFGDRDAATWVSAHNRRHASHTRGVDLLRAVATCYFSTSREFLA
jgi:hypothetical protein